MNEINLLNLLDLALRKMWALILAFVIAATGAYCYCKFVATPRYSSTSSIIVTNGAIISESQRGVDTTVAGTDVATSLNLVATIIDILKTPDVYKKTAEAFGGKYSYTELRSMANIQRRSDDTLFVDISFIGNNPEDTAKLATLFAKTACNYITEYIPYSTAEVASTADKSSLTYPRTLTTTGISGLIGAAVLYLIFFIFETTNKTIKSEEDFTAKYKTPVLGLIPDFENADLQSYNYRSKYNNKEAYRNGK